MPAVLVGTATFGFADGGGAGHSCDFGSVPAIGQTDIICVNSDATVALPVDPTGGAAFVLRRQEVTNQGAYIYSRKATGGEGQTVTITTGANTNASVIQSRWANVNAFETSNGAQVNGSVGMAMPAVASGVLAETNELAIAFAANHNFATTPVTPVWGGGFSPLATEDNGTGVTGAQGLVGYRTDAGTASVAPTLTWTNGVSNRYALLATFTTVTATGSATIEGTFPMPVGSLNADVDSPGPETDINLMNFGPAVTGIAECVCLALESSGRPVCSCCLTIGTPVSECDCECADGARGRVSLYPQSIVPSQSWPQALPAWDRYDHACGPPYIMLTLNVEITRCVPTMDELGNPPTCTELISAGLAWYADATIVRQAVGCCLRDMKRNGTIQRFSMGQTTPVPEQGGCAGSVLQVMIGLSHCLCVG